MGRVLAVGQIVRQTVARLLHTLLPALWVLPMQSPHHC